MNSNLSAVFSQKIQSQDDENTQPSAYAQLTDFDSNVPLPGQALESLSATYGSDISIESEASASEASASEAEAPITEAPITEAFITELQRRTFTRRRRLRPEAHIVDLDLSNLHNPELKVSRDHVPPPQNTYNDMDSALDAVYKHAKAHGVLYVIKGWANKRRNSRIMTCSCFGKPKDTRKLGSKRRKEGAASRKTGCKMQFTIAAVDNTDLEHTQWRVVHALGRKSIEHNHPPASDPMVFARYRRATRTLEMRTFLQQVWPLVKGSKQALLLLNLQFPEAIWTQQDVINEHRRWQQQQLQTKTKVEALLKELAAEK